MMKEFILTIIALIITYIVVVFIAYIGVTLSEEYVYDNTNPTALEVYQGKTTLKITYIDSIPIDSIVVFKNEFKK